MSEDDQDGPAFIEISGVALTVNMLMGALRRQAYLSLGGSLDASGNLIRSEDDDAGVSPEETKALMVKMAAQGLRDTLRTGLMDLDSVRDFVALVAKDMDDHRKGGRGH